MQNPSRSSRTEHQQQQQQGAASDSMRNFKPVRLPAVAAAVQVARPAQRPEASRMLPFFLREANGSD